MLTTSPESIESTEVSRSMGQVHLFSHPQATDARKLINHSVWLHNSPASAPIRSAAQRRFPLYVTGTFTLGLQAWENLLLAIKVIQMAWLYWNSTFHSEGIQKAFMQMFGTVEGYTRGQCLLLGLSIRSRFGNLDWVRRKLITVIFGNSKLHLRIGEYHPETEHTSLYKQWALNCSLRI